MLFTSLGPGKCLFPKWLGKSFHVESGGYNWKKTHEGLLQGRVIFYVRILRWEISVLLLLLLIVYLTYLCYDLYISMVYVNENICVQRLWTEKQNTYHVYCFNMMMDYNNFTCRRYNFKTSQMSCELNSEMSTKCIPFSKAWHSFSVFILFPQTR